MAPSDVDDIARTPLDESAALLTLAMRSAHAGHWALDLRSGAAYWSPEYAELIGVPLETRPSWGNWLAAVHPDDRERAAVAVRTAIDERREIDLEFRVVRSDRAERWVVAKGRTFCGPDGEPVRIIGVAFDVTERKRAASERAEVQARLRASEEQTRNRADELVTLMEATPAAIWIAHDPECRVISGSRAAHELLRVPAAGNLSLSAADGPAGRFEVRHDGVPLAPHELPVQRAARGEDVRNFEEEIVFPDGSSVRLYGNAVPLRDASGTVRGAIGAFVDITPLATAEAALRETQAALSESSRRKDEFLAMLAHELRNPLAPIHNAARVLQRLDPGDPRVPHMHAVIERQTEQLTRIVDDLLDVARITEGRITLRREPTDVASVVARAIETSRPLIDDHRHHLAVTLPPEPVWVEGDPARLSQVLSNLLNNAARYTQPGGRIWITVEEQDGDAVLRVRDDGIGIAPDVLPRIFDMFMQGQQALDRSHGIGIGLTLVRRLTELHGGRVEASSPVGAGGSEFVVRLPALPTATRADRPPGTAASRARPATMPRRIVVVDDNVDSAQSLAMLLEHDGHAVHVAHAGEAAIAAARAFRPDVMLLDIGLPGISGYDVARRLRLDPTVPAVTLVAITGYGQDHDRERASAAGFDHHLTKPVDYETLAALLGALRGGSAPDASAPTAPAP